MEITALSGSDFDGIQHRRARSPVRHQAEPWFAKWTRWTALLANACQIGLLALAGFGYYYTVIPIYQKSLLDEDIARKNLELYAKEKQIADTQSRLTQLEAVMTTSQMAVDKLNLTIAQRTATIRELQIRDFFVAGLQQCTARHWLVMGSGMYAHCMKELLKRPQFAALASADRTRLEKIIDTTAPKTHARVTAWANKTETAPLSPNVKIGYIPCVNFGRWATKTLQEITCSTALSLDIFDKEDTPLFLIGADGLITIVNEFNGVR